MKSFRWDSRTCFERGKEPSQKLVDLDVNMLTSQIPSRACILSLSSFVSLLKCHLTRGLPRTPWRKESTSLPPYTLFSLLSFFSIASLSFNILHFYLHVYGLLLSPECVALGAGILALFMTGPQQACDKHILSE